MFVMCDRQFWYHPAFMYKKFMTVLNPEIIEASKETCLAWEGCISNDEHIALVERPKTIKVRFQTYNGKETDQVCKGLMSRIFQHEIDHFDGVLMEDLAKDLKSIDEFKSEEDFEKFRVEQKDRIIEY
jgi:peptide deformylase